MNFPQHIYKYRKKQCSIWVFAFLTFVFLFIQPSFCCAQHYTDADTATVEKLLDDATDNDGYNIDSKLVDKALTIAQKIKYQSGYVRALRIKGLDLSRIGNTDSALSLYNKALQIAEENGLIRQQMLIHILLGNIYSDMGDFKKSIAHFDIALKAASNPPDSAVIAEIYNGMGTLMHSMQDYPKALEHFIKAANIAATIHLYSQLTHLYNNIGSTYITQKNYTEGFKYLKKVIALHDSLGHNGPGPVVYMNLAICFDEFGSKDSCLHYYFKALALFQEEKDVQNEARLLNGIGTVYYEMERWAEAEKYYKLSLAMAKESSNLSVISQNNYDLSTVYYMMGDYKKAFLYRDSSAINRDSLYNHEQIEALTELTTKYKTQEIQQQNTVLQKENDLQKLRIQRKNIVVYSILGLVALFSVIGFLLVRQNTLRNEQQRIVLEQKQLLAQINPHFIFNCLNSIQQFVVQNDTINANRYLADFALLMRQTLDNSKDGIITLKEEMEYLENYLSFEHMRFEDKFTYTVQTSPDLDPESIEIPSMIIQPFVENAIRHGLCNLEDRRGVLQIIFYKESGFLYCKVDDNGIGMQEARKLKEQAFIKHQSHGMELTRQRLALVSKLHSEEYKISIVDKVGPQQAAEGTTIIIKFPLQV